MSRISGMHVQLDVCIQMEPVSSVNVSLMQIKSLQSGLEAMRTSLYSQRQVTDRHLARAIEILIWVQFRLVQYNGRLKTPRKHVA